jgi:hypothetical protein
MSTKKQDRRKIVLHYHVFKNAGTSVDQMLEASLGDRWIEWDKPDGGARISAAEMEEFILDRPELLAVSSHQVVPPIPSRHLDVYPLVFIRHPIDRAYSAYLFEWKKQKGSEEPAGTFGEYVTRALSRGARKSAIDDFQAFHFANRGYQATRPSADLDDEAVLANAKDFLRSLPAFGIVERYGESMKRIKTAWGGVFPDITFEVLHANALQDATQSLSEKMKKLRTELGNKLMDQLVLRNQMDLRLYEYASACFDMAK